jgi:nucleotide-binding universal stress UspA family protein
MAATHPTPIVELPQLFLKHILVPVDFSEHSHLALQQAAAIARLHGSDLVVLHAVPPEPIMYSALQPATWEYDLVMSRAEKEMEAARNDATLADVPHEFILQTGYLEDVLLRTTRDREISMLVLGTHGRSGVRKLILGSVAEEIFRIAPCPVLTIGPDVPPALLTHGRFQSVLFATDFSEGSRHALPYAIAFATESQAQLTLLHVLEEGSVTAVYLHDHLLSHARAELQRMVPEPGKLFSPPGVEVASGYPVEEILRAARKCQADLIVLGVHKSSGLGARTSAHLPWTIAHSVVGHAQCPVLTVRG